MTELRPHEPFFSIVIPTYNREDIVKRAIESCLCQSFQDFEIIVVDDGSSDATHASVLGFQDPRISYVWQPNAGGAVARNTGARKAQGKFLAFLDSDDAFDPEKLAVFHAQLCNPAADTERTVFYSPLKFWRGAENVVIRPDRPLRSDETVGEYLFAYDGLLQTSTLVLSRTLFDCVKFDPSLRSLQDLDLCLRLEAFGARFEMISEPLVIWFDVDVSNRISYSTKIDAILQWSATKRELLNDRAWAGFQARYVAPRVARRQPLHAIGLLWRAAAKRAVSPTRAVSLLMRGIAPGLYGRLRDTLVTLKQRKLAVGAK